MHTLPVTIKADLWAQDNTIRFYEKCGYVFFSSVTYKGERHLEFVHESELKKYGWNTTETTPKG